MKIFLIPYFIFLFSISTGSFVFAQQCKSFDLRPKLGPALSQDKTGWCFAYAASELVSHKLGRRVSPIDMASKYHKGNDRQSRENIINGFNRGVAHENGGFPEQTISYLNDIGFCSYDKTGLNSSDNFGNLKISMDNLNDLISKKFSLQNANRQECKKIESVQKVFPGVSLEEIQRVAEEEIIIDVTSILADKSCGQRIKTKKTLVDVLTPKNYRGVVSLTDSEFQSVSKVLDKNQPVVVVVKMEQLNTFNNLTSMHAHHAMTIVGRRFNSMIGECEYIVRNSWGPECLSSYLVGCEDGNLIVPESKLRSAMYQTVNIE